MGYLYSLNDALVSINVPTDKARGRGRDYKRPSVGPVTGPRGKKFKDKS